MEVGGIFLPFTSKRNFIHTHKAVQDTTFLELNCFVIYNWELKDMSGSIHEYYAEEILYCTVV